MKSKFILVILIGLLSAGIGYYIFIYRPQEIKLRCMQLARYEFEGGRIAKGHPSIDNTVYQNCLKEFGLLK